MALSPENRKAYQHFRSYLKRQYGLSIDHFLTMYELQKGRCGICQAQLPIGKNCHVDHCHETNSFRGILCSRCNTGLGMFKDNENALLEAANYIVRHKMLMERVLKKG